MILLVGRHGFLGRHLERALAGRPHRAFAHDGPWAEALGADTGCLVWCGRDPRLGTPDWRLDTDLELAAARRCAATATAMITLSSRKVYAPAAGPLGEDAPTEPVDAYGRQKLALERALAAILGPRLTVLRLANITGFEPGRRSFMGLLLTALRDRGTIRFDMSPFTERDFLPVETAARWIARLAEGPPGGILNLGSGRAMPVGRIALAVMEGFGGGRLLIEDWRERDAFRLDTHRLRRLLAEAIAPEAILAHCRALGRRLREDPAGDQPMGCGR